MYLYLFEIAQHINVDKNPKYLFCYDYLSE